MKILRGLLDKAEPLFEKGGKLEKLYPLYEVFDTFVYTPKTVCTGYTHVRDAVDLKRSMSMVVVALLPAIVMGMYNVGYQITMAASQIEGSLGGMRLDIIKWMGFSLDPSSICSNIAIGASFFIPIYIVTSVAGGLCEVVFSLVRKHEVNEGFLVTGLLFPLILPPTIPLWQVAVGIIFGVIFAKEVFGGTGKNFLNPALTARAFLFFAYPAAISGDAVWVGLDGVTGATALSEAAVGGMTQITASWTDTFYGIVPGSFGETSTLAILIGAIILIATGVGSWRIMLSIVAGAVGLSLLFNAIGSDTNQLFSVTPMWHMVLGGFAFGTVFMATDPVTASMTYKGQYFYGLLVGAMVVLIRVINPAYPEGMMLAILFGNICAPLIDFFVTESNIKRRELRNAR